jgi:2-phosphosulfolactate phosphatase
MCQVTVFEQDGYDLRVEWGLDGVRALGPHCAVLVIIDVLVFTTTVDVALSRGARVLPLPWRDERAAAAAGAAGAVLTPSGLVTDGGDQPTATTANGWTLRPSSLKDLPPDTLLALTSANGGTLCAAAADTGATVLAGCLRNASAVAAMASTIAGDRPIGVVPAGERWKVNDSLRPSIEDHLGAGAVAAAVTGRSAPAPEATLAALAYQSASGRLSSLLAASVSGRELVAAGMPGDVALASEVDTSTIVPVLSAGVFAASA